MKLYEELLWRGLIKDVSDEVAAKQLLNKGGVKFYCGFDPTGESLTVGHMVQIIRMKLLEQYGHIPVVLIGGATGLIGDPRQTSERKLLTLEQSLHNAELLKIQLSSFLDPKTVVFVNNNDWISKIDMISFLRDYGKNFNINYMLAKENVAARLDAGISYTEFSYMIIQAIDFHHLYKEINCQIQFGGSDQWGNITTGLELIRKLEGANHTAVGLSSPLLLKSDGTKFGKSETGALWLDKKLTSPYEIYQYFLNVGDDDVVTYLKTLTLLPMTKIEELELTLKREPEKRVAQRALAETVTKFMHGSAETNDAKEASLALFTGDFKQISKQSFEMITSTLEVAQVNLDSDILEVLMALDLATSKREAREFIKNGAININDIKIDLKYQFEKTQALHQQYFIIKRGRRRYGVAKLI